jgi:hypothetical protein
VADYAALADKLRDDGKILDRKPAENGIDLAVFYQNVRELIASEVEKANAELRKRDLPVIERIFMPGFHGKLSMTFGTALLCSVDLDEEKERITAALFGPPNRCEISRKEFFLTAPHRNGSAAPADPIVKTAIGFSPDRIAGEIVSGIIMGEFS